MATVTRSLGPSRAFGAAGKPRAGGSGRPRRAQGSRGPVRDGESNLLSQALAEALALRLPADAVLRRFFRDHPEIGRRDRANLADTVFDVLRNRRLYAHFAQAGDGAIEDRLIRLSRAWRSRTASAVDPAVTAAVTSAALGSGAPETASGPAADWLSRIGAADLNSLPAAVALSLPIGCLKRSASDLGRRRRVRLAARCSNRLRCSCAPTRSRFGARH